MAMKMHIPQIEDRLQEAIWQAGISDKQGNKLFDLFEPELQKLKARNEELREALELIITSPEWIKLYGGGAVDKKAQKALKGQ